MEAELDGTKIITSSLGADIYHGFWINRAVSKTERATLTLDHRTGALLIAFVALFVNASGRGLWKLIRCILHFKGSSQARPDGLYLQRQATLRNSNLALDALFAFLDIWRVWRNRRRSIGGSSIPHPSPSWSSSPSYWLISLPILSTHSAFAYYQAGIFSSRVSQGWNEVLIRGLKLDCGVKLEGANFIRSQN